MKVGADLSLPGHPEVFVIGDTAAAMAAVNAQPYYRCTDGLWFVPAYGASGVYYRVVTAP